MYGKTSKSAGPSGEYTLGGASTTGLIAAVAEGQGEGPAGLSLFSAQVR